MNSNQSPPASKKKSTKPSLQVNQQFNQNHISLGIGLPKAQDLALYSQHAPKLLEVVAVELSAQGAHQRDMEKRYVRADVFVKVAMPILVFVVILAGMACSTALLLQGKNIEGAVAGITAIGIAIPAIIKALRKRA